MTRKQENELYKRFAKEQLKQWLGITVPMTRMILLESTLNNGVVTYVMFEDRKTGKQYQTWLAGGRNILLIKK